MGAVHSCLRVELLRIGAGLDENMAAGEALSWEL